MSKSSDKPIVVDDLSTFHTLTSRRDFVRLVAMGGALVLTGGLVAACEDSSNVAGLSGPGTGATLTIDFSMGDVALLQFLYLLEQLEADFHSRVVANFAQSDFTSADQLVLTDVANHDVIHRDVLGGLLGAADTASIAPLYGSLSFRTRAATLAQAVTMKDWVVGAYDGLAPYFTNTANLAIAMKLASVEARHSAALHDLISPLSTGFAPLPFEPASTLDDVATNLQPLIEQKLAFASEPAPLSSSQPTPASSQASAEVMAALQACLLVAQLQSDFYGRALAVSGLIPAADVTVFATTASHEASHVATLQSLITSRGGVVPTAPAFDYTAKGSLPGFTFLSTQFTTFAMVAQALEDLGVRTFKGQLAALAQDTSALISVLSMHAVQARHACEVRRVRGKKGWVTSNNRDDLPAFLQPVYDGEDNTNQGGVNALTLAAGIGGSTTASEAFDEARTTAQTMTVLAFFLP